MAATGTPWPAQQQPTGWAALQEAHALPVAAGVVASPMSLGCPEFFAPSFFFGTLCLLQQSVRVCAMLRVGGQGVSREKSDGVRAGRGGCEMAAGSRPPIRVNELADAESVPCAGAPASMIA